jgi:hypothetical protein
MFSQIMVVVLAVVLSTMSRHFSALHFPEGHSALEAAAVELNGQFPSNVNRHRLNGHPFWRDG